MPKPFVSKSGTVRELDAEFFSSAKRGRPPLPDAAKKQRVNLMLDPDVVLRLKKTQNMSVYVNSLLRKKLVTAKPAAAKRRA